MLLRLGSGAMVVTLSPHLREWDLLTMPDTRRGSVEALNPFKFYLGAETPGCLLVL